jgi:hypothetical protein
VGIGGLGLGIRLLVVELQRGWKRLHRMLRLLGRLIRGLRGDHLVLHISQCPLGHYHGQCVREETQSARQGGSLTAVKPAYLSAGVDSPSRNFATLFLIAKIPLLGE